MRIKIDVSPGELLDKITILNIKTEKIHDEDKLKYIKNELSTLTESYDLLFKWIEGNKLRHILPQLNEYIKELHEANFLLWDILQRQRDLEKNKNFGEEFISLSLDVYHTNDKRALYKRKINELLKSDIAEVKFYIGEK